MNNNSKATEQDISITISDFNTFCHYVEERKTKLSKRRAMLGKNDLFEINALLHHKENVAAANYQQESYPTIDLIFQLMLLGKLYERVTAEKGNIYLAGTTRKQEFDGLNVFEKYAFLFEIFWSKFDFKAFIFAWQRDIIDTITKTIALSSPGKKLTKGSFSHNKNYDVVFSYSSVIIKYLAYFGICNYIPIKQENKKQSKYDESIKSVFPTEFGINLCKILVQNSFTDWNIPAMKEVNFLGERIIPGIGLPHFIFKSQKEQHETERLYSERKKKGYIPLYKFLEPVFLPGVLKNTVTSEIKTNKGSYIFKVFLNKDIWRKIKLSSRHTLEDLHYAIQEAFSFDDDHLYSFFMDGKRFSGNAYHSPMGDDGPYTDEVKIGELELYVKQKFLYLFDYGDSWEFNVHLLKMEHKGKLPANPEIIEIKGESPEQYVYDDEYDDAYFEDEENEDN